MLTYFFINLIILGKAMGNHPCEKLSQENYSEENTLHSNRRRSESSVAIV